MVYPFDDYIGWVLLVLEISNSQEGLLLSLDVCCAYQFCVDCGLFTQLHVNHVPVDFFSMIC